jgi:hypothetical protein
MKALAPVNFVAAAAILLAGCGQHAPQATAAKYKDDGVRWGAVVDGLKVGIARRTYVPGREPGRDQVYFTVQIHNVGERPVRILAPVPAGGTIPEDLRGDESVRVNLTYDSAAGVKTALFTPPKRPVVQTIEAGREYRMELRLSPTKFGLDRFVAGSLRATYSNAQETIEYHSTGDVPVHGLWTGDATSGSVPLDSAPAETKRMAAAEQGGGTAR